MNYNCQFGLGIGQVHPEMDPNYLFNDVFWKEPPLEQDNISGTNEEYQEYQ